MRRGGLALSALVLAALPAREARAADVGLYRFDPKGKITAARTADVNGDGRKDLILIVERREEGKALATEVVILRTPAAPAGPAFYADADVTRIPCSGPEGGPRAVAGAVAIGRFGEQGAFRLRWLAPRGFEDEGGVFGQPWAPGAFEPTLLGRSAGAPLVFWDAVADLDGDGLDECWFPDLGGRIVLASRTLGGAMGDLAVRNAAQRTDAVLFGRKTTVPTLFAADVDGDGKKELIGLEGSDLVVWRATAGKAFARADRVPLPFLVPDPSRPPEELHTPRLTLADVDGDGKVDLLVTLVQGRGDKVGGLKTSLYHYPGPFFDAKTHALVEPRVRIDTESVALHPRFVDVDGDGKLDYVADSIRGNMLDLVKRVMGAEPTITYTAFRFDPAKGTFEGEPFATVERPYSGPEARGNTFGRAGFFEGDFDGDGVKDLLDLGNLTGLTVLRGGSGKGAFHDPIVGPVPVGKGETLAADALVADLNGDGRADAAVWSARYLYLVVSKGAK